MVNIFDLIFKKKHTCSCSINTDKCKFIENEKKHKCSCSINTDKCRTSENEHNCTCKINYSKCMSFKNHECICEINFYKCKSVVHKCVCKREQNKYYTANEEALDRCKCEGHYCTCLSSFNECKYIFIKTT